MMKLEMATTLTVEALQAALQDPTLNVILIDCRSFIDFNSCHITSAHNVHFPPIVKRRSGGSIPLDNIIRCAKTRALLLGGHFDLVVVYDDSTRSPDELSRDSVTHLVLKSLTEDADVSPLYLLEGGFRAFSTCQPLSCTGGLLATSDGTLGYCSGSAATHGGGCHDSNGVGGGWRDSAKMRRLMDDQDEPVQVLPWLYLGSAQHALQLSQLKSLGVCALLNVSSVVYADIPDTFCYKTIPVADSSSSDLSVWFPEAIDFIESVRLRGGKVLVHCQAGISRSATVCLAYLMCHKGLNLDQAYDFLKARRSIIAPNLNFMRQLLQFETELEEKRKREINLDSLSESSVSVTVEAPTPIKNSALTLTLSPTSCAQQGCGYIFSFDSPRTPLAQSPTFASCSPLVSPS